MPCCLKKLACTYIAREDRIRSQFPFPDKYCNLAEDLVIYSRMKTINILLPPAVRIKTTGKPRAVGGNRNSVLISVDGSPRLR